MKKVLDWFFGDVTVKASPNAIYRATIAIALVLTLVIAILLGKCSTNSGIEAAITFLVIASACFAGGGAVGFLFGLPKISSKTKTANGTALDTILSDYEDNTNLQEVSDWLTKIIVGLTLIKLNTIISWLDAGARGIATTYAQTLPPGATGFDFYVFGYCIIVFYFLLGAGLLYLWARTDLKFILQLITQQKQLKEKTQDLKVEVQNLVNKDSDSTSLKKGKKEITALNNSDFRASTEILYNSKPIAHKDDLQRNRWGGKSTVKNYVLEARYDKDLKSYAGMYDIRLTVVSTDPKNPVKDEVAFFLHDTFKNPIRYVQAVNNRAELTVTAWESFVVGARLSDGTELELDLNTVKGFPTGFYWT